ncbi:MAG: respiratory nitrate reductase subunit gamma [Deltaproteobacteria bacterium]|nr:respiratory nitrate reductase subunit gamma [Deltaproteobacteria bacterium]
MPPLSQASRPLMWNIPAAWMMYVLFAAALAVFAWGMYRRVQFWRAGKADDERFRDLAKRFGILFRETFLQKQVRNSPFPAVFHSLIFYSFAVLFLTTLVVMVQCDAKQFLDLEVGLFKGWVYVFFTVASELAGVFLLVGVAMAAWRRLAKKPETVDTGPADVLVLLFLAGIVVTGFLAEGLRIAVLGDDWRMLTPVGWAAALVFSGVSEQTGRAMHGAIWWTHTVLAMGWIASIPFTKFVHMLALPANVFFSKLGPRGELRRVDIEKTMETAEGDGEIEIGVRRADELTWKQRLDMDACISCGRCEEVCPAFLANKESFTPRRFIAGLRQSVHDLDEYRRNRSAGTGDGYLKAVGAEAAAAPDIVGTAFDENFIWHCRTCTACMEVCPAFIEHVDTLMEVRRNEVLIQGRMPPDAARALRMLESQGNPFGPQSDRVDWVETMGVRVVGPGESCDVIYWIGCCATFDPQKQKIAKDLCTLMGKCGIDFGVLGPDERCCGDPARVIGQEMLFQKIAREQVALLKSRRFSVLLTSCPHCYNVLRNEYRQFGGEFNVVHHSEFLHEMLWGGRLQPKSGREGRYVYHDPCYLGRYQKIYDSPREVLRAVPGAEVVEMKDHREKSMCCGGGGGHYWMDLKKGERINNLRVRQARDAGADTIVTGCAYCLHMLEDSLKLLDFDGEIRVVDLATLMLESTDGAGPKPKR